MDDSYDPPDCFATALDELHELVAREVGTTDFGGADYLPGLRVILQSMDYDPHFSERGRRYAWGTVVGVLKGRAQAIKSMAENPGFVTNGGEIRRETDSLLEGRVTSELVSENRARKARFLGCRRENGPVSPGGRSI